MIGDSAARRRWNIRRSAKYAFIGLIGVALVCGVTFAVLVLPLQPAPASQVAQGIHFVSDGRSTIAIVPTAANQVLLVDSGMDAQAAKVLAELSKMGLSQESVTAILFTHGHPDHIGGATQFPHAERMALRPDVALIAGFAGAQGPVTRFVPVSPTGLTVNHILQDGETFLVGRTQVKVFALPGHTMGSAAYLIDGVLFLGDSANATRSGKLQSAVWLFSDDLESNKSALRRLNKTLLADGASDVKAIAFGHSGVLENGMKPLTEWVDSHQ